MKKIRCIFCFVIAFLTLIQLTQTAQGSAAAANLGENRFLTAAVSSLLKTKRTGEERMGSADTLSGKVYTLAIFISTPNNPWKKQDKLKVYEIQREAQDWLISEAENYGVELTFQGGSFGLNDADISVPNIPTSSNDGKGMYTGWGEYLLKKIGYKSSLDLWTSIRKKTNCDNLQVIVYSNSKGVSYSLEYKPKMDAGKYFVEVSFMHRYHTAGSDINASRIAHEILHQYSAWDLYNSYQQERDVESKAKEKFPDDIMLRVSNDLTELEVGELTAWRIGWNDEKKSWYDWFNPDK